jgi:hypothetical protein
MSSFTNEFNNTNTFTESKPEVENSGMYEFIEQIKEQIVQKKLNGFKLVDYSVEPPKLPILKPTLNATEINAVLCNIKPGQLVLGKSTLFSKVMVYMDEDGIGWTVAVYSNDTIIDVEYCGKKQIKTQDKENDNISCYLMEIINSVAKDEISWDKPNVYNKTESNEYKMILTAVLKGLCLEQTVELEPELVSQTIDKISLLTSWKVILVKSINNQSHVFVTKDANKNIWAVETDWTISRVFSTFQLI